MLSGVLISPQWNVNKCVEYMAYLEQYVLISPQWNVNIVHTLSDYAQELF